MTVRHLARAALVATLAPLAGCATLFTGTSDTLSFQSNVPGVRLSIDGRYEGELPLTLPMSRNFMGGQQFVARFEKAGYQTQEFRLSREFNAVAILDVTSILTSGGIDVLTGALLKFSPTDYHVQMLPEGAAASDPAARRSIDLWGFALVNSRGLQRDVAAGGGERLAALAALAAPDDAEGARRVEAAAVRAAPALLAADGPHAFATRLDDALRGDPALRALAF